MRPGYPLSCRHLERWAASSSVPKAVGAATGRPVIRRSQKKLELPWQISDGAGRLGQLGPQMAAAQGGK